MKYLKTFENIEEGIGDVPFDTLLIVEVKTIEKKEGEWKETMNKFAGWRDSRTMPNDITLWRGTQFRSIPINQIKKYWVAK
jgi:hypothetical protein